MKSTHLWNQLLLRRAEMLTYCFLLILLIEKSSASSYDWVNNELGSIRQEIKLLRDENQNQTLEITSLKLKVESQDEMVRQKIIEELDNLSKAGHIHSSDKITQRSKRPIRLLPRRVLLGKKNNDDDVPPIRKFYGPPTNCSDLSLLGYTLNGYYLVKPVSEALNILLETVYCAFKQESYSLSTVEKRIGYLKFLDGYKSEPLHTISNNSIAIEPNVTRGISSPRMGHLVNDLGKCFALSEDDSLNGRYLYQWECYPTGKGQLWSWNEVSLGSGDKHLCNGYGKCASVRGNDSPSAYLFQWDHLDAEGQRFDFLESLARPGFYLIKNSNGKCISVPEKTGRSGAIIYASHCNALEPGQNWKWNHIY